MDNYSESVAETDRHESPIVEWRRLRLERITRRAEAELLREQSSPVRSMPICDYCWSLLHDGQGPYRMEPDHPHRCCHCGHPATGLFTRVEPSEVRYPIEPCKQCAALTALRNCRA